LKERIFLAIDIGNSAVKFGLFQNGELKGTFAIKSDPNFGSERYWKDISGWLGEMGVAPIGKIAISSVVPTLTDAFSELAREYLGLKPQILDTIEEARLGFKVNYDDPTQLGADRLANIVAARALYGYPAIVVDIGTATTFDVIDESGNFIGGLIAPGPQTSAEALFSKAAKLFAVPITRPGQIIATNTSDAMKSGIYFGALGQISSILDRLIAEIKDLITDHAIKVIVTGGLAELFAAELKTFQVDSHLTLRGLQLVFDQ
jgi:type III pantothenate kinase